ncbi:glycosyltransferase family 87 protein [Pontibacter qinzhouensis]|uniref:glycosyltransferase family 87 protein n=1 Tax=Pontibacter qinzhouensis TaxID=2603253 RepID=UPI00164F0754|nr:glycosyltransferase family 87 protein [Pontibacter qinzhouensis]
MNSFEEKLQVWLEHPKTFKLLLAIVSALSVLFLVQTYRKAYRAIGYDLTSYLLSSEALLAGANPYQTDTVFPYIYPLFLCVAMVPLALVPYWLAVFVWFGMCLGALFYSATLLLRLYNPELPAKKRGVLFGVSFLFMYAIFSSNFLNGQINPIILLLAVLFIYYYLKSDKGKATWFLSAAIIIKLTPAIFLMYLFLKRDFKYLLLVLGQCLVLGLLVPWLFAGNKVWEWYGYYLDIFLKPKLAGQSEDIGPVPFAVVHFVNYVLPQLPKLVAFAVSALLVLLPILYVQLVNHEALKKDKVKNLLLFCLYMLAMLLISPMSEKHHLVHVYPAIMVMIGTMALASGSAANLKLNLWLLGAVVLLLLFGQMLPFGYLVAVLLCYVFVFRQLVLLRAGKIAMLGTGYEGW